MPLDTSQGCSPSADPPRAALTIWAPPTPARLRRRLLRGGDHLHEIMPSPDSLTGRLLMGAAILVSLGLVPLGLTAILIYGEASILLDPGQLLLAFAVVGLCVAGPVLLLRIMRRRAEIDRRNTEADLRWAQEAEACDDAHSARMILRRSHLAVLGLQDPATAADVHRAYRALALLYHPDMSPGDRAAAAVFRSATEARDFLLRRA